MSEQTNSSQNIKILTSKERIVTAARNEVESKGILGLRVQDVATEANVSVPLIYKYFVDRDGLLTEVLGQMFEELVLKNVEASERYFNALATASVDDFVAVMPYPRQEYRIRQRWMRIQILAASIEIPRLRERLSIAQAHVDQRIVHFFDAMQISFAGKMVVSSRALALLTQSTALGFVLNDLVVDDSEVASLTDEEYSHMLKMMFTAMFTSATSIEA